MSIFTFMGESILCYDDGYSFEVIKQTISSIIPPLMKVRDAPSATDSGSNLGMSRTAVKTLVNTN